MQAFVKTSFPVECLGVQSSSEFKGGAPRASPGSTDVFCALSRLFGL